MFNLREKIQEHKTSCKVAAASLVPAVVASVTSVTAFAADGTTVDTSTIRSTMTSSFTSIGNDIVDIYNDVLPIALVILGVSMVITIGVGVFKKISKKSASG